MCGQRGAPPHTTQMLNINKTILKNGKFIDFEGHLSHLRNICLKECRCLRSDVFSFSFTVLQLLDEMRKKQQMQHRDTALRH